MHIENKFSIEVERGAELPIEKNKFCRHSYVCLYANTRALCFMFSFYRNMHFKYKLAITYEFTKLHYLGSDRYR